MTGVFEAISDVSDLKFTLRIARYACGMNNGKFVLAQLLDWIHPQRFQRCVDRYHGDYKMVEMAMA